MRGATTQMKVNSCIIIIIIMQLLIFIFIVAPCMLILSSTNLEIIIIIIEIIIIIIIIEIAIIIIEIIIIIIEIIIIKQRSCLKNCNTACCAVWVWNLVSHTKAQQAAGRYTACSGGSIRRQEGNCIMRSFRICTALAMILQLQKTQGDRRREENIKWNSKSYYVLQQS